MNSKAQKKDENTLLTEMINISNGEKQSSVINDPQSNKVQKKFDEVFSKNDGDLDFLAAVPENKKDSTGLKVIAPESNEIKLDLESDDLKINDSNEKTGVTKQTDSINTAANSGGFEMDEFHSGLELGGDDFDFNEGTKKTVVINSKDLSFNDLDKPIVESIKEITRPNLNLDHDEVDLDSNSGEFISKGNTKDKIETTLKAIVASKDDTADIDLASLVAEGDLENHFSASEENVNASDQGSELDDIGFNFTTTRTSNPLPTNNNSFVGNEDTVKSAVNNISTTDLFDVEEMTSSPPPISQIESIKSMEPSSTKSMANASVDHRYEMPSMNVEDNVKVHSTIRQLIEEREILLSTIKQLKQDVREYEQDNLTLKACLDESKIEVNILKKRFVTELEDYKHQLLLNEEKKSILEERVKQLEKTKDRFEQKARIDINQIRQREKELENKIELMSMDIDSQIHGRDQKILELRRKIDSLEFNMENVTIREQKTADDKRKLEDKLNKIMKTLRNSIKNLEEDIESSAELKIRSDKDR